ncbi:hypothetical protein Ais01nite_32020 [Asanoa ishikariensis]|nr:hypothetical protein Ais01nite_32020 [Asanoa ishikariensis]
MPLAGERGPGPGRVWVARNAVRREAAERVSPAAAVAAGRVGVRRLRRLTGRRRLAGFRHRRAARSWSPHKLSSGCGRAVAEQGSRPRPALIATGNLGRMQKWEYATVPLLVHATKQILDNWGDDGWELVSVIPGPNPEQLVAYLKRPKA